MSNEEPDKLFNILGLKRLSLRAKVFFVDNMPALACVIVGLTDTGVYFTPTREADKGNIWFAPWSRVSMLVYEKS